MSDSLVEKIAIFLNPTVFEASIEPSHPAFRRLDGQRRQAREIAERMVKDIRRMPHALFLELANERQGQGIWAS